MSFSDISHIYISHIYFERLCEHLYEHLCEHLYETSANTFTKKIYGGAGCSGSSTTASGAP